MRYLRRTTLAVLAALLLPLAFATTASAESFRYWGYFQWTDGAWAFAQTGPADTVPEDGSVEGWRFAVGDETSTRFPRTGDVFEEVCGSVDPAADEKRVAVVIDYGTAEDAPDGDTVPEPRGECAQVPADASGADVLAAVAEIRSDAGLTCALDGYPSSGCGDPVDGAAPTDTEQTVDIAVPATADQTGAPETGEPVDDASGSGADSGTVALVLAIVAVVAVAVAAAVRMRRRPTE
jgi:hypothetical protein